MSTNAENPSVMANPTVQQYLPVWITCGLAGAYLVMMMIPPSDDAKQMHLYEATHLPVVDGGRVMPLDTVARNSLMVISGRQTFEDSSGRRQPAIKWLLDVMTIHSVEEVVIASAHKGQKPRIKNEKAFHHPVFRVENDQVINLLELDRGKKGFRYSMFEMLRRAEDFEDQVQRANSKSDKQRDLFDAKVLELAQHWSVFGNLRMLQTPLIVPPSNPGEDWRSLPDAVRYDFAHNRRDSASLKFIAILNAYAQDDVGGFNEAVSSYQKFMEKEYPDEVGKTDFEVFFNSFAPFYQCSVLYVFVLVLVCVSWVSFPEQLRRAAFSLALLTLAVHTFALFGRMYLMGRPLVFVTNLYSSAVFIGWMTVMLGLVLEYIFRNGLGVFVAAVTGSLTLLVGHYLATTGDTLEMMQAVLDTNFWLATHVTSVTIGYSATFVAGFLGIVMIIMGVFTTKLNQEMYRNLGRMIYGIVCFAMLFSFVGTVLGGIWADQSWGRFWGWDPKENGALLIVLWNALILHARWGGMVQQRGMAVLAVVGNIITTWSWFGVNMLGVGLHSYGFTAGQLFWVLSFVGSQLVVIGIGLVPMERWASFAAKRPKPAPLMPVTVNGGPTTPVPATAIQQGPVGQASRRRSKHYKARR
jgi:ABC-type transport system involved in cytochrome c biogenesis permease subunit